MLKRVIKICLNKEQLRQVTNYRIKQKYLKNKKLLKSILDKENYINQQFKKEFGYEIDFTKEPRTFNEKIQFRKLYTDDKTNKLYATCADKYKVREYVANKIGGEYLIPLELVTDKLTLEDWNKLSNDCVIKANHNSGPVQVIFDKNKESPKIIIDEINFQLTMDYGILSLESYYSLIDRRVIVEKLLKDKNGKIPSDYKFYCFRNSIEVEILIQVIDERTKDGYYSNFYNQKWESLNFYFGGKLGFSEIKKPKNLEKMIEVVKKLSEDFDYARIDLYNMDGKIYFGEITFCPNSGMKKPTPISWDLKLGELWKK